MPWIQRDWDLACFSSLLNSLLNRCPEFKGIETLGLCGLTLAANWIDALNSKGLRPWRGSGGHWSKLNRCPEFKGIETVLLIVLPKVIDWIDALNSKGLRRSKSPVLRLRCYWIDALNSKGLRLADGVEQVLGCLLNRCPEFKGIETHDEFSFAHSKTVA